MMNDSAFPFSKVVNTSSREAKESEGWLREDKIKNLTVLSEGIPPPGWMRVARFFVRVSFPTGRRREKEGKVHQQLLNAHSFHHHPMTNSKTSRQQRTTSNNHQLSTDGQKLNSDL
jgi:hypothetical protein